MFRPEHFCRSIDSCNELYLNVFRSHQYLLNTVIQWTSTAEEPLTIRRISVVLNEDGVAPIKSL